MKNAFAFAVGKQKKEQSLCLNIPTVWDGMIQLFDVLGRHSKNSGFVEYKSGFDPLVSNLHKVGADMRHAITEYEKEI